MRGRRREGGGEAWAFTGRSWVERREGPTGRFWRWGVTPLSMGGRAAGRGRPPGQQRPPPFHNQNGADDEAGARPSRPSGFSARCRRPAGVPTGGRRSATKAWQFSRAGPYRTPRRVAATRPRCRPPRHSQGRVGGPAGRTASRICSGTCTAADGGTYVGGGGRRRMAGRGGEYPWGGLGLGPVAILPLRRRKRGRWRTRRTDRWEAPHWRHTAAWVGSAATVAARRGRRRTCRPTQNVPDTHQVSQLVLPRQIS